MREKIAATGNVALTAVVALCGLGLLCPAKAAEAGEDARAGKGLEAVPRAAKAEKHLFVFFYRNEDEQTRKMREVFEAATRKVQKKAEAIAINVADPAEEGIVGKFKVRRAPMPLVLVVAPNGAIAGGFPMRFDEDQLLSAFLSPCMAGCLKGLQDRKLVFICIQNEKTKNNEAAMKGVRAFQKDRRFSEATEVLKLDPSNRDEKAFLTKLRVDPGTDEAITVFLAPPGAPIATIRGATDKDTLVAKLMTVMSGCGSGPGCGISALPDEWPRAV